MKPIVSALFYCFLTAVTIIVTTGEDYTIADILEAQRQIHTLRLALLESLYNDTASDVCQNRTCLEPVNGEKGDKGLMGTPGQVGESGPKGKPGWRGRPCFNPPRGFEVPLKGYHGIPGYKGRSGSPGTVGTCTCNGTAIICPLCPQRKWGSRGPVGLRGSEGFRGRKGTPGCQSGP